MTKLWIGLGMALLLLAGAPDADAARTKPKLLLFTCLSGAGCLDAYNSVATDDSINGLIDKDSALVFDSGALYPYTYNGTSTQATASPTYIRPPDYTTQGVWHRGTVSVESLDTSRSATPYIVFRDSDTAVARDNVKVYANCTDTGDGTEDCDYYVQVMVAGTLTTAFHIDADGNVGFNQRTIDNVTLDVAGTNTVLKQYGYIQLLGGAFKVRGSSVTAPGTTQTDFNYGLPKFADDADKATNYIDWVIQVPPDINTAVDLTATLQIMLGGADTGDHEYIVSMVSIAGSAAAAGTPANAISLAYTADASGADGDYETTAEATLTDWKSNVTAGQLWRIRLERDGDHANDTSTVDSYPVVLILKYGSTQ